MPTRTAILLAATLALSIPAAASDWQRIGPGYEIKQAKAYCNLASMGVGSGYYAYGSEVFVIGVSLANAISTAIIRDQAFSNCMTLQGWERTRSKSAANFQAKKN